MTSVRLWLAGVAAAVAAFVYLLADAFRRGRESERARQAAASEAARRRADAAAAEYDRRGGAIERLKRGEF